MKIEIEIEYISLFAQVAIIIDRPKIQEGVIKLRQCSNGLHDWLEEGLFDLEGITIGATDSIVESLIFRLPERVAVLQKVNALVDLLLPDLTNSNPNTFYLRTVFAQAINLLGSVPFCYGFGDFEKGLACYVSGVKALNEFTKLTGVKL